jgi:hypothetical protein
MSTTKNSGTQIPQDRYWAAEPPDEMPALIVEQVRRYWAGLDARGIPATWRRFYRLYYGQDAEGGYAKSHAVGFGGDQGEQIRMRSNHVRNLARRYLAAVLADRPAFSASAVNDGSDAQGQTTLTRSLLDAALDDGGIEQSVHDASEMCFPFGEGYVYQPWDFDGGEPAAVEQVPQRGEDGQPVIDEATGQPVMEERPVMTGDVLCEAFTPVDVARDLDQPPRAKPQWVIVRRWAKKWDLVAKYPEKRQQIVSATADKDTSRGLWHDAPRDGTDWLPVFTLYHERTRALPAGRVLEVIDGAWLTDGANPYESIPVHRIRPASEMESDTGYSDFWDLIATQEGYDAAISALVSVIDVQGMPNLLAAEGQEITPRMMEGGGRIIYWRADGKSPPPAWMAPPPIADSFLRARDILLDDLTTNSGSNAVARGNPDSNTKAASAQALAASMATQFMNAFAGSVAKLYRELGDARVKLWQRFATIERTVEIAGPDEAPLVTKFKGSDIAGVRQVRVELAPAALRTIEGKIGLADRMLEAYGPEVIPPQTYMMVYATGRFEPIYKRQASQVANIRSENERLMRGEPAEALQTDNHYRHIQEHACLLDDPEIRMDEAKRAPIIQHIVAHAVEYDALRNEQPALWAITQEPLPPAMMGMLMALGGGAPANGPPGEEAANGPPADEQGGEADAPRAQVPGADMGGDAPLMPAPPGGERLSPDGRPMEGAA